MRTNFRKLPHAPYQEHEGSNQRILFTRTHPILEKAHFYSKSENLVKSLQILIPAIKSCSVCTRNLQEKFMRNSTNTHFRDLHLDAKRVLGRILPSNLSLRNLHTHAIQWLYPIINLNFFTAKGTEMS